MGVGITGKADNHMELVFLKAYKTAFVRSVEFLFTKVFENAPVSKTKSGTVNLRNALKWDFDFENNTAHIGVPKGSEMEMVAFYTEMGTGERGQKGWTQFFDEKKPQFTIPIVPINAKALHFVNERGEDVFMKESKGQPPQSWMRRAFYDNQYNIEKIWKREFSDSNIKALLKQETI